MITTGHCGTFTGGPGRILTVDIVPLVRCCLHTQIQVFWVSRTSVQSYTPIPVTLLALGYATNKNYITGPRPETAKSFYTFL